MFKTPSYFAKPLALRDLLGQTAFNDLKKLLDPCCGIGVDKICVEPCGAGGGGCELTSLTYAELVDLVGASGLTVGCQYLITDFQTSHYIQFSGDPGTEETHLGDIEPLIVTAATVNSLEPQAISPSYPNDTILYLLTATDRDYDYAASTGKGVIYFRRDNLIQVARDYDWRNVVFRRWETLIGNGKFWAFFPVIGAAFQDSLCFKNSVFYVNSYIKSPLSIATLPSSVPYWLDNTVINTMYPISDVYIGLAFGNTFEQYDSSNPSGSGIRALTSSVCAQNIVISNRQYANTIADFETNTIISLSVNDVFANNNCAEIGNNTASQIAFNTVTSITNNFGREIKLVLLENEGTTIDNNTVNSIIGNKVSKISHNTANFIVKNVGISIFSNVVENIENNAVVTIDSNSTTSDAADITGNVGSIIQGNILRFITDNIVNSIKDNQGSGGGSTVIESNSGRVIHNNQMAAISQNLVEEIWRNRCGIISFNVGSKIQDCGDTVSAVANNYCDVIDNITLIGQVNNNTLNGLSSITGTGNLSFNTGIGMNAVRLNGNIIESTGLNINNSAISSGIVRTSFNGLIDFKAITPSVNMANGTNLGSIVKLDFAIGEYREEILTAGVLTYSAPITA